MAQCSGLIGKYNLAERDENDQCIPGYVHILNYYKFKSQAHPVTNKQLILSPRDGTYSDVAGLSASFSRLGFEVTVYNDKTRRDTLDIFSKASAMDYSRYRCVMVVILSHGDAEGWIYAKDEAFRTWEVWEHFERNPSLQGKPKVFIFNACRGKLKEQRITFDAGGVTDQSEMLPNFPDCLVVYSTFNDHVSLRNTVEGSWFVQELCKELQSFVGSNDLLSVLTKVTKNVIDMYDVTNKVALTPVFASLLRFPVVFSRLGTAEPSTSYQTADLPGATTQIDGNPDLSYVRNDDQYQINHHTGGIALVLCNRSTQQQAKRYHQKLQRMAFKKDVGLECIGDQDILAFQQAIDNWSKEATEMFLLFDFTLIADKQIKIQNFLDILHPGICKNLARKPKLLFVMNAQMDLSDSPYTSTSTSNRHCNEHSDFFFLHAMSEESTEAVLQELRCCDTDILTLMTSCIARETSGSFSFLESTLQYKIILHERYPENFGEIKSLTLPVRKPAVGITSLDTEVKQILFRDTELNTITRIFKEPKGDFPITLAITGQAGIGKSYLIKQFLNQKKIKTVWIPSPTQEHLDHGIQSLRDLLKKVNAASRLGQIVYTTVAVVFDDVTPNVDILKYLPLNDWKTQFIVITTSLVFHESWSSLVDHDMQIRPFKPEQSIEFIDSLTTNLGCLQKTNINDTFGNIPLMITMPALYAKRNQLQGMLTPDDIENIKEMKPKNFGIDYPYCIKEYIHSIIQRMCPSFDLDTQKDLVDIILFTTSHFRRSPNLQDVQLICFLFNHKPEDIEICIDILEKCSIFQVVNNGFRITYRIISMQTLPICKWVQLTCQMISCYPNLELRTCTIEILDNLKRGMESSSLNEKNSDSMKDKEWNIIMQYINDITSTLPATSVEDKNKTSDNFEGSLKNSHHLALTQDEMSEHKSGLLRMLSAKTESQSSYRLLTTILVYCAYGQETVDEQWDQIIAIIHHNMTTENNKVLSCLPQQVKDTMLTKALLFVERTRKDIFRLLHWLLVNGANSTLKTELGKNVLHLAAENNVLISDVTKLVETFLDLNDTTSLGETALHLAVRCGNDRFVDFLVNKKVHMDMQNHEGDTALHIAARKKNEQVICFLIQAGADCNISNNEGKKANEVSDFMTKEIFRVMFMTQNRL